MRRTRPDLGSVTESGWGEEEGEGEVTRDLSRPGIRGLTSIAPSRVSSASLSRVLNNDFDDRVPLDF